MPDSYVSLEGTYPHKGIVLATDLVRDVVRSMRSDGAHENVNNAIDVSEKGRVGRMSGSREGLQRRQRGDVADGAVDGG